MGRGAFTAFTIFLGGGGWGVGGMGTPTACKQQAQMSMHDMCPPFVNSPALNAKQDTWGVGSGPAGGRGVAPTFELVPADLDSAEVAGIEAGI